MRQYTNLSTGEKINMWHQDAVHAVRVLGWPLVDSRGYWADSAI